MTNVILYYVTGVLIACGLQTIWFCSNLPVHISKLLRILKNEDNVYTWEEWQLWLTVRAPVLGELLSCTVCLSFWVSLFICSIQVVLFDISNYKTYVVVCATSWPGLMYAHYKLTNK